MTDLITLPKTELEETTDEPCCWCGDNGPDQ
jgi:hypothetical protein